MNIFGFEIPENYSQYLEYLPVFGLSVLISLILTPIAGYIARRSKIIADPPSMRDGTKLSDFRHLEKQPTPLLGGLAVIIPLILLTIIHTYPTPQITSLLLATTALVILGAIDDIYELPGTIQMFLQILIVAFVCISPINVTFINNPIGGIINLDYASLAGTIWNLPFELILPGDLILGLWILVCINAVKWVSGTDGLLEGNAFVCCITLFLLSVRIHANAPAVISIIFAGLILGFLFFNFYPAKIRSGSSGKSTYGFILAVLSVLSGTKFATAIIILMLPLIDFFWVIITRIIKNRPKNIISLFMISDQNHLHHKLLNLGLSEQQIAFTEYLATAIFGTIALALTGAMKAVFLLVTMIIVAVLIGYITFKTQRKQLAKTTKPGPKDTPEKRYTY